MSLFHETLRETQGLIEEILADAELNETIERIGQLSAACIEQGHKLMFAGNGGSAADAQHIAAEFVSRLVYDRPAMAALALTTDTSALTAIGNDYGYEQLFARQISALGREGDILFAISTSGRSPNILAALKQAREMRITTVGFAGKTGGDMKDLCDHIVRIPSLKTAKIQEMHITVGHVVCGLVEAKCHPR